MKCLSIIAAAFAVSPLFAVEFDCVTLPTNLQSKPDECDPAMWCSCLKTGITAEDEGATASFQQAIIYAMDEPTIGTYEMVVQDGTLDISGVSPGQTLGTMTIDWDIGQPQNFYVPFEMIVTEVNGDTVKFDDVIVDSNDVTRTVLTYDPMDEAHSSGLVYRGSVTAFGNSGFTLTFEYIAFDLPAGASSAGVESADLFAPNFTIPVLLEFPKDPIYTLPYSPSLPVTTTMGQITDFAAEKSFEEEFVLNVVNPPAPFRRGDANASGTVEAVTDAVFVLAYLFLADAAPPCPDAADVDDSGMIDMADPVYLLCWHFLGNVSPPPTPGPTTCGGDEKKDELAPCTYTKC